MFCRSCGSEMPDGTKFCPSCGVNQIEDATAVPSQSQPEPQPHVAAPQPQYSYQRSDVPPSPPPSSMPYSGQPLPSTTGQIVFAIINIVCCGGSVFGIIALVFAIMAGSAKSYDEAVSKLKTARILNIIGIVLAVLVVIFVLVAGLLPMIFAKTQGEWNY